MREMGELPVNLKFLFEGCEESNSTGLHEFIVSHPDLLRSDVTYFSDGSKNHNDSPIIALGVKGMLYVELRLTTMTRDLHSQYAPVLPSAAWQMVELLGKIKKDGKCLIPGFYDDVLPVTPAERAIYDALPDVRDSLKATYNAYPTYDPELGYYGQLNGMPSCNISGLLSGHVGEGTATVLTSTAMARIDMRLVQAQDGEKILASLKKYIKDLGYDNVEVICHGITPPSKTPLDTPYLAPIQHATEQVFGCSMVYPNLSRPRSARICAISSGVASPPVSEPTTSPGARLMMKKTMKLVRMMTGISISRRLITYLYMPFSRSTQAGPSALLPWGLIQNYPCPGYSPGHG